MSDVHAAITCDAEGCTERIAFSHGIDEATADAVARREGWRVRVGMQRSYHHCPKHKEQER